MYRNFYYKAAPLAALLLVLFFSACKKDDTVKVYHFDPSADAATKIQEALIDMKNGEILEFGAGTFVFNTTLSGRDLDDVIIRGAGKNQTILDFSTQTGAGEGIRLDNMKNVTAQGFTIKNSKSDGIKIKGSEGVKMIDLGVVWDEAKTTNGGYALYPVSSKNVLMDNCYAKGASDAGIYVGQCTNVIMKNCKAEMNVAGIEIENTLNADVFDNLATNNTGGILVFDLPGLPLKNGGNIRVYNNTVENNNHPNFAAKGGLIAEVPAGTGVLVLAGRNVEIYNNNITNNNKMGCGAFSYDVLKQLDAAFNYTDSLFNPYASAIYIHDNAFARQAVLVDNGSQMIGSLFEGQFGTDVPDMIIDGIVDPALEGQADKRICIKNNGNAKFVNMNAPQGLLNKDTYIYDLNTVNCELSALSPVTLP